MPAARVDARGAAVSAGLYFVNSALAVTFRRLRA